MRYTVVAVVMAPVLLVGCGSISSSSSSTDKFKQTWPTAYAQTTCAQWLSEMTSAQQFAAAADMLVGAQSTDDKSATLPSDSLIESFAGDVSEGCQPMASMKITDAAIGVYTFGRQQYGP